MAPTNDAVATVMIMDGGMGHMLRRLGVTVQGEVGSVERFLGVAMANQNTPELVEKAHRAFIDAGAQVVITNNYSCIPAVVGREETVRYVSAAGKVARQAIGTSANILVAGSLPPLEASYRHDLVQTPERLAEDYTVIAGALAPYVDVFVCETMSCAREAAGAYAAGAVLGKPMWVSWALSEKADGTLLSGETVEMAVEALGPHALEQGSPLQACFFNCSQAEAVEVALPRLRAVLPEWVRIGCYANGFKTVHSEGSPKASDEYREDFTPEVFAEWGLRWQAKGATIIGGCCGIFPEHIKALQETLQRADASA